MSVDNSVIDVAIDEGLDADAFYSGLHGQCAQVAVNLRARGDAVDPYSWSAAVPDLTPEMVVEWGAKVASTANAGTHIATLKALAYRRWAQRFGRDVEKMATTSQDPDEVLDYIRRGATLAVDRRADDTAPDDLFVDWASLWDADQNASDWLFDDVLAKGRAHALYARHKVGKSLFMLWVCAELATGPDPVAVVYLDFEMTDADLRQRLEDMGYGPSDDLSRLCYAMLPTLPPLNTSAGADALSRLLDRVEQRHPKHHLLVVVDTTSRAVQGEENSADTIQDYYRHTGIRLKQRGVTSIRLDHAGKDAERGQRGSSAKGDDVDVIWKLSAAQDGIVLKREPSRIAWVPEKVQFAVASEPLRYARTGEQWPAGTKDVAEVLDRLQVPIDATGNSAVKALRDGGEGRSRAVVLAAQRWRRQGRS